MPASDLRVIKRFTEFKPKTEIKNVPTNTRGLYALLKYRKKTNNYNVVYVGMAGGKKAGIKGRLKSHAKSVTKKDKWTHFSVFEVWDNITENEIKEIEGFFRQVYRKDGSTNKLNKQKQLVKFKRVRKNNLSIWK